LKAVAPLEREFVDEGRPTIMENVPDLEEAITDAAIEERERTRSIVEKMVKAPQPELPPVFRPPPPTPRLRPGGAKIPEIEVPGVVPVAPPRRGPFQGPPLPAFGFGTQPFEENAFLQTVEAVRRVGEPFEEGFGEALVAEAVTFDLAWQEMWWGASMALIQAAIVPRMRFVPVEKTVTHVGVAESLLVILVAATVAVVSAGGGGGFMFNAASRIQAMFPPSVVKTGELLP